MSTPADNPMLRRLTVLRLIVAAMIAGAVVFLVIVVVVRSMKETAGPAPDPSTLSYGSLAYALVALIGSLAVPGLVSAGTMARLASTDVDDRARAVGLVGLFTVRTIIAAGLVEGAALLATVAHLVEGSTLSAATACSMILFLMFQYPRRSRFPTVPTRADPGPRTQTRP